MTSSIGSKIWSRKGYILAGGGVYCSAVYLANVYFSNLHGPSSCCNSNVHRDDTDASTNSQFSHVNSPTRTQQFAKVASSYDQRIKWDELLLWIPLLRRSLIYWHAKGTILEVAAGTGRNIPHYYQNKSIKRVLMVDNSPEMLQEARSKLQKVQSTPRKNKSTNSVEPNQLQFAIQTADASRLFLPNDSFDTVIDTFGLCSFDDPVDVLKEMARVCKPNGKILLLEHGRSHSWPWLNQHLDQTADQHAAKWGCVWNRDLDSIILDQAKDDLQVQVLRRFHFGTTYYVVAKPIKKEESTITTARTID